MSRKILHIIDSLVLGGAETLLVNTVNSLENFSNHIVTLAPQNDFDNRINGDSIECIGFKNKKDLVFSAIRLRRIIKKNKIEIVHAHLFWSTIIARIACIGLNVKFVFSLHTVMSKDSFDNSKLMTLLEKVTYSKKEIAIGVSNTVLKDYDRVIGIKGRSHVLYNFIEDQYFNVSGIKKTKEKSAYLRLVAVGNIKPVKNYMFLIEVFKKIDNTKFLLDIFGDGVQRQELEEECKKHNLNITFRGKRNQLYEILPDYDAYIMPSLFEGFGIAPLEAMALEIPVILSDIDVFKEIADGMAIFFNPIEVQELVDVLGQVREGGIDLDLNVKKSKIRAIEISKKENYLKTLEGIYLN